MFPGADELTVKKRYSRRKNRKLLKPGTLNISDQSARKNNIYLNINDLTPALIGQFIPAGNGQD